MFAVHKFAMRKFRKALLLAMGSLVPVALAGAVSEAAAPSFAEVVDRTQPKMVKIYGAGGLQRL